MELWKWGDCITKYALFIIFSGSEPPQYIVVAYTGGKTGDMGCILQLIQSAQNSSSYGHFLNN
jgi:hypothetical protein